MPWEVLGASLTLSVCASTRTFLTFCLLRASMGTRRHEDEHACSCKRSLLGRQLCPVWRKAGGRLCSLAFGWICLARAQLLCTLSPDRLHPACTAVWKQGNRDHLVLYKVLCLALLLTLVERLRYWVLLSCEYAAHGSRPER